MDTTRPAVAETMSRTSSANCAEVPPAARNCASPIRPSTTAVTRYPAVRPAAASRRGRIVSSMRSTVVDAAPAPSTRQPPAAASRAMPSPAGRAASVT
nr:hypothetical protein [Micromonospora sp. 4G51]